MKTITVLLLALFVVGCSSTNSGQHRYCSVSDVSDPTWYNSIKNDGVVAKFGVEHTREAERDIARHAQLQLAQQLYSRISSRTILVDGVIEQSTHRSMVASNVYLEGSKVSWAKHDNCLVAWAGVSKESAQESMRDSFKINQEERAAWKLVYNSYSIDTLEKHIKLYPLGIYRATAEERIESLRTDQQRVNIRDSRMSSGLKLIANALISLSGD